MDQKCQQSPVEKQLMVVRDADRRDIVLPTLWRSRRCIVVFLRHFGCRFCKQHTSLMKKMKAEYEANTTDDKEDRAVFVLVAIGASSDIEKFRKEFGWDGELYVVPDVKDTQGGAYGTFKLAEGAKLVTHPKVQGPNGLGQAAAKQGFEDGGYPHPDGGMATDDGGWDSKPDWAGNALQLGGVFVVGPGNTCDFSFRSEYAGHFPDPAEVLNIIAPASDSTLVAESTCFWADKLGSSQSACPMSAQNIQQAFSSRDLDVAAISRRDLLIMGAVGIALAGLARRNWLLGLSGGITAAALQIPRLLPGWTRSRSSISCPDFKLLTPLEVDEQIINLPGGVACDCGYVPKIEMEKSRRQTSASLARREIGFIPEEEELEVLATTLCYVREFLAKPHPVVGRGGPVCPFIPKTLKTNCLYMAMLRVRTSIEIEQVCMAAKAKFKDLKPDQGNMKYFRAIVLVFPDVPVKEAYEIIDGTQDRLKDVFVKDGLMLGEFHLINNAAGLRNPDFFPLRTPYPTLAMRHMVPSDLPFLKAKPEWTKAYLSQFDTAENFAKAKDDLKKEAELALCT